MRLKTFTILLLTISFFGCGSLFFPGNVKIDNPSQVVADARALIKEFNADPQKKNEASKTRYGCLPYKKEQLPATLQLDIQGAFVCEDHVSLIFYKSVDDNSGLRIWSADAKDKGSDKSTGWADIYSFTFNGDIELSRDNNP